MAIFRMHLKNDRITNMLNPYVGVGVVAAVGVLFLLGFRSASHDESKLAALNFISTYQDTPGAVLLDVRTPSEYAEGHLKSAINIDFYNATFTDEIAKLDKSKTYFVYCRSGNRSGKAVAQMRKAGFEHLYDLDGGTTSNQKGLMLVTDDQ